MEKSLIKLKNTSFAIWETYWVLCLLFPYLELITLSNPGMPIPGIPPY